MEEFEHQISELTILPSKGGVFEVVVDDELVFSKRETGKHAEFDAVLAALRSRPR